MLGRGFVGRGKDAAAMKLDGKEFEAQKEMRTNDSNGGKKLTMQSVGQRMKEPSQKEGKKKITRKIFKKK